MTYAWPHNPSATPDNPCAIEVLFTDEVRGQVDLDDLPDEVVMIIDRLRDGAMYLRTKPHLSFGRVMLSTTTPSGHTLDYYIHEGKALVYAIGIQPT